MSKTIFAIVVILLVSMNAYGESDKFRKKLAEAESGDANAQLNIGMMYFLGQGIEQKVKIAADRPQQK